MNMFSSNMQLAVLASISVFIYGSSGTIVNAVLNGSAAEWTRGGNNTPDYLDPAVAESPFPYEFPPLGDANDLELNRFPMPLCDGVQLEETTIDLIQEAMSKGQLTTSRIINCYLQRIFQTDDYIKSVFPLALSNTRVRVRDSEQCG